MGGLEGAPEYGYLEAEWLETRPAPTNAFMFAGYTVGKPQAPYPWTPKFGAPAGPWPPPGRRLTLHFRSPRHPGADPVAGLHVDVHHEMYVGAPIMTKWVTVSNGGPSEVVIEG